MDSFEIFNQIAKRNQTLTLERSVPANLSQCLNSWINEISSLRKKVSSQFVLLPSSEQTDERYLSMLQSNLIQDAHWNWDDLIKSFDSNQDSYILFCKSDNEFEGILLGKRSFYDPDYIFEIKYLAIAPWNRIIQSPRKFKNIGTILLAIAGQENFSKFQCKKIILSSLPQSESYYNKIGFISTGKFDKEGLKIFEMSFETFNSTILQG